MKTMLLRFIADESAATAIEYALIGTLISVAIVLGAVAVGTQLNVVYSNMATHVSAAAGG